MFSSITWHFNNLFICDHIERIEYGIMFGQIFVPTLLLLAPEDGTVNCGLYQSVICEQKTVL